MVESEPNCSFLLLSQTPVLLPAGVCMCVHTFTPVGLCVSAVGLTCLLGKHFHICLQLEL